MNVMRSSQRVSSSLCGFRQSALGPFVRVAAFYNRELAGQKNGPFVRTVSTGGSFRRSSHQHDRFAIIFFILVIHRLLLLYYCLNVFLVRLIRASVTIIARSRDFSRPNTIYSDCLHTVNN